MKRRGESTSTDHRHMLPPQALPASERPHAIRAQPADYERALFPDMAG